MWEQIYIYIYTEYMFVYIYINIYKDRKGIQQNIKRWYVISSFETFKDPHKFLGLQYKMYKVASNTETTELLRLTTFLKKSKHFDSATEIGKKSLWKCSPQPPPDPVQPVDIICVSWNLYVKSVKGYYSESCWENPALWVWIIGRFPQLWMTIF